MPFCYFINVSNLFYSVKPSFLVLPLSLLDYIIEGAGSGFGLRVLIILYCVCAVYIPLREAYILSKGPFCRPVKGLANRLCEVYGCLVEVYTSRRS